MTTPSTTVKQTINWRSLRNWTMAAVAMLTLSLTSTRAGTITVVNLPATGTDAASGISSTSKHYLCAFAFGNTATIPTINGVPFTQIQVGNTYATTNVTDTNFGGTMTLSVGGPAGTETFRQGNSATQGNLAGQADGNMRTLLTGIVYFAPASTPGGWIKQDYAGLTVGDQYSLRIYYRYWGNTVGDRQQNVSFNGEGTQQDYSGNPLAEDAGGAHFVEYDFTASSTDVTCVFTSTTAQPFLLMGATLEDDSYTFPPVITQQPSSVAVNGSSASFNVMAGGTAPLAYQWYFNTSSNYAGATETTNTGDGRISGSATSTLTITNVGNADSGYYFAIVTNNYGAATSAIANLQLIGPSVTQQPSSATVNSGASTSFNVMAGGTAPLAYQWYFNTSSNYVAAMTVTNTTDGRISGSTTTRLTITNVAQADSGYYFAIVTSDYGAATSAIVNLNVIAVPSITSQTPTGSFSLFANQTETLSVTVSGGLEGLAYLWFTNGVRDVTGTSATYYASAASSTPGETFQCIVTNDFGSATSAVVTLTAINPLPTAVTSSHYSTNVLALNPASYWPMHEAAAPSPGDIETNYGSLGALGNGYYADWANNNGAPGNSSVLHQITGALANDPDGAANMLDPGTTGSGGVITNSYLVVPHTSPLTTLTPPFTIELWVMATNTSFGDIISQDGTKLNGGNNNNGYGFRVTWGAGTGGYDPTKTIFQTYVASSITTPSGYVTNQWHYVVVTCDGSSTKIYIDNAQAGTAAANFKPDSWDPLTIGAGIWNGGGVTRQTAMSLDEVAIYTNVLSTTDIGNHWSIATNSSSVAGDYYNAVIGNNPLLYYRMDSPSYSVRPPANTWSVLTNYGVSAGNGVYMPGVAPGSVAGPKFSGLSGTNAMPGNGVSAFADAGYNPALNPTSQTPFSVTACFKGNPADSRYQNIVGHSDSSWRIALNTDGRLHFNAVPGGANDAISSGIYNDGNWHQVIGVYDGTSNYLYVDGVLDGQALVGTNSIPGSSSDVLLGADPQYLTANTGAGRQFAGNLCEVAFFNNALTAEQVQSLYQTLGVPVTSVSVPVLNRVGGSDVFSVTANGTSPVYQWFSNTSSNYDGAIALTDTGGVTGSGTASLTIADLTVYYFAVATNDSSSATSSIVQVPQILTALSAGKPIWNQTSHSNVLVGFSDLLDPATAALVGNYALDNGASVLSAEVVASNEVALTTSPLDANTPYTLTIQNVSNYWGIVQTPNPTSLSVGIYPANIALWLRADTGVTTDVGTNTVNQWNDLSGNNNNFYSGGGVQPQLVTNAWGDPVIRFNTTDTVTNYMAAGSSSTLAITRDMSVIAVVNFSTLANGTSGDILSKTGDPLFSRANIAAPYDYYVGGTAALFYRGNGNGTTNGVNFGQYTGTQAPAVGSPCVVAVSETGNTVSHYINGKAAGTGLLSNGFQETDADDRGQAAYIGARADGHNRLKGDLAELIVTASPISGYDAAALDAYLATQHHFVTVNTNPTNIVVSATGNQLTLSWPADHTGWQLQSNAVGLTATNEWFTVSGSTATNQIFISPDMTKTNVFYRMLYQP